MDQWSRKFAHLTATAVFFLGAMTILLILTRMDATEGNLPLLMFLCGAVGAVVGNYQRLSKLSGDKANMQNALANSMVTIQIYVSPFIGGIFAMVLFAAFFSGLVQGDFFPQFDGVNAPYTDFHDLLKEPHPTMFKDAMKGLFWCFLAGYSERFVPNILDRLAEEADKK